MIDAVHPKRPTDDRRAEIARAARALIVEKGFEGLRTRDIAERVGINIATLHYHVPSKEALIELVAESLRAEFIQQSIDRPRAHLSARERMDLEFVDFRELAENGSDNMLVYSEFIERGRRDERIAAVMTPMREYWRSQLARILAEGVADGVYRADIDAEVMANVIIAAMVSYFRVGPRDLAFLDRLVAQLQRTIRNPTLDTGAGLSKPAMPSRHRGGKTRKE